MGLPNQAPTQMFYIYLFNLHNNFMSYTFIFIVQESELSYEKFKYVIQLVK